MHRILSYQAAGSLVTCLAWTKFNSRCIQLIWLHALVWSPCSISKKFYSLSDKLKLRWRCTRRFATTIFSATQRCNIVATLFRMFTKGVLRNFLFVSLGGAYWGETQYGRFGEPKARHARVVRGHALPEKLWKFKYSGAWIWALE